jgi:hypothetical protein
VLAADRGSVIGAALATGHDWVVTTISADDGTKFAPALTFDAAGEGIGVYTSFKTGHVTATIWKAGHWSKPAAVDASTTAYSGPVIDANGGATAHLAYVTSTYAVKYATYANGWSTPATLSAIHFDTTGGCWTELPSDSSPVTVAARGADATLGFVDTQSNCVTAVLDVDGGSAGSTFDFAGSKAQAPPALVAMNRGPELMAVFVMPGPVGSPQPAWAKRTGGTWSKPAFFADKIAGTTAPPYIYGYAALAATADGGAVTAYPAAELSASFYSLYGSAASCASCAWDPMEFVYDPTNDGMNAEYGPGVGVLPGLAHGISGHVAEMAWVTGLSGNKIGAGLYSASYANGSWSPPAAGPAVPVVPGLPGGPQGGGVAAATFP